SLDRFRTIERILLHWNRRYRFVDVRECSSLIAKRRTDQRETFKQHKVFWLFLNKRLQFASRLAITLDSGGMIARDFLRPAQPGAQLAIYVSQRWVRFGQYLL